jgi:hypothetical protein
MKNKVSKTESTPSRVEKREKHEQFMPGVRVTQLSWLNPITGKLVGYQRARILNLLNDAKAVFGIKNPKTGRLVSLARAKTLGLLSTGQ